MSIENYGPIGFLIGKWESDRWTGENQAPDPDREVENTQFRQMMIFEEAGLVENHEQALWALRYHTKAWEEGGDDSPFHEEVGYFIWDADNMQVMKSFIVPRGIAVNAGGSAKADSKEWTVSAKVGDEVYGICSNPFLDKEFKSLQYDVTFKQLDQNSFSYDEDTQIQMKNRKDIFHHTEKNTLKRV